MDALFDQLALDRLPASTRELVVDWGTVQLRAFLFVLARLTGMLLLVPAMLRLSLPRSLQVGLTVVLALVLTPTVGSVNDLAFQSALAPSGWLWGIGLELLVGVAIGLGVALITGSLLMAGTLIDPQMGLTPRDVLQQSGSSSASLSGQMLMMLGIATLLVMPSADSRSPNGILLIVDAFVNSFESLPGDQALSMGEMVIGWLNSSLSLCLLVAAPLIASATLVGLFVSVLGRATPELNTLSVGFPLRFVVCLLVLSMTISGQTSRVTEELARMLNGLN